MTSIGPGSVVVAQLARDLHRMGEASLENLRTRFERLAQPVLAEARGRASWSSRIPGALSVRGLASSDRARVGIELRVSAAAAPHGRPYEDMPGRGSFRHPVYGDTDVWVPQAARPFAAPAVAAKGEDARRDSLAAYEDAARTAGFR